MTRQVQFNEAKAAAKDSKKSRLVEFLVSHGFCKNDAQASFVLTLLAMCLLVLTGVIAIATFQEKPQQPAPDPDSLLSQ